MRLAFTIIYDGLHHLLHNNYAERVADMVDEWVIVEGHAKPGGSTGWCKDIQMPVRSTDGCHEFLGEFSIKKSNVTYYSPSTYWESKDSQVNKCLSLLNKQKGYLWQIDCDEQWTEAQLKTNEWVLDRDGGDCGAVRFNHYVGMTDDYLLIATGEWGSAWVNRVWKWEEGKVFASHEPAVLEGQKKTVKLPEKFEHYAYCFEQDIVFKEKYYGYKNLKSRWQAVNKAHRFPIRTSALFGSRSPNGRGKSSISRVRRKA